MRITVLFFVALLASSEYYEYCSNPSCNRLGQNAWLILAIMQVTNYTSIQAGRVGGRVGGRIGGRIRVARVLGSPFMRLTEYARALRAWCR